MTILRDDGNRTPVTERQSAMTRIVSTRTVAGMARLVLPVLSLLALVAACGDDPDGAGLPIIRASSGAAMAGTEMAANSPMVGDKMMYRPVDWKFVLGRDLPALDSSAWAWVLDADPRPSDEKLRFLVDYFGITGEFVERTEGAGEPWEYTTWMAGSTDGSEPSINLSSDAMLSWWYSAGFGPIVAAPGCVLPPEIAVDPAVNGEADGSSSASSDASVVAEPAVEPMPCGPTEPPVGVPSKDEAIAKFREMASAFGYSADDLVIDAWADDWNASVTGWVRLDGVRSPLSMSASYGENGELTWASGVLAEPRKFAEYPRVGTAAAIERMTNEYNGMWTGTGGPMARGGGVAIEPAVIDDAATSPVSEPMPPIDSMPVEPETITVTIEGVEEELVYVWSEDGAVYLVPGYAFLATQDGYESRYLVSAMPDEYVQQAEVPGDVTTDTGTPDTAAPGSDGVNPGVDVPAGAEKDLIGLSEKAAIQAAESEGWIVRVVARDGEEFPITMDYSTARVNLTVVDDIVTEVYVG